MAIKFGGYMLDQQAISRIERKLYAPNKAFVDLSPVFDLRDSLSKKQHTEMFKNYDGSFGEMSLEREFIKAEEAAQKDVDSQFDFSYVADPHYSYDGDHSRWLWGPCNEFTGLPKIKSIDDIVTRSILRSDAFVDRDHIEIKSITFEIRGLSHVRFDVFGLAMCNYSIGVPRINDFAFFIRFSTYDDHVEWRRIAEHILERGTKR